MTRTEYQNAVRDLLALDALPKEMDYSMLLPPDNAQSGFDNIADLLFVSPTAMESYLGAAEKISRLAVGDLSAPVMFNLHRMPDEQPQTARTDDELPHGTRGGLLIKSEFPLDGEYAVKVTFLGSSDEPQKLEIAVDGERVRLETIGAAGGGRAGRGGRGGPGAGRGGRAGAVGTRDGQPGVVDDDAGPAYGRGGQPPLEVRVPVKAGRREIAVAFVERNEVRDEQVLRPRMRGIGPALAIGTVTLSGPYNGKGPGDTLARQRIFICKPVSPTEEVPCSRRILSALERRAYRRPVTDTDIESLMPFYTAGRAEGSFDLGIQRALQRLLVSPQFLFRIEHDPASAMPGSSHPVTDLELASRL